GGESRIALIARRIGGVARIPDRSARRRRAVASALASGASAFAGPAQANRARAPLARFSTAVDPGRAAGGARRRGRGTPDPPPRPPPRERRARRRGDALGAGPPGVARLVAGAELIEWQPLSPSLRNATTPQPGRPSAGRSRAIS